MEQVLTCGNPDSLGYVMTQALVESGADAAIVDLNRMPYPDNSIIICTRIGISH